MGITADINQDFAYSPLPGAHQIRERHNNDEIPPEYFDSEPSSQPPNYLKLHSSKSSQPSTSTASGSRPAHQHHNSASADTVAAILASPYEDLDAQRKADRKKNSIRERWRAFKERNFNYEYDASQESGGSAAEWNVMGARPSGGMQTANRKKS
ncbi:hypothetical protein IQ06DRAFT_297721 [Phaeosphaeriaceae sp. SRC1lsM3a]|nr:hypothetical protein IQ06DRAFT_297721 [Stagonospora sp. SRC1lsM3a]